jgi:hypothetical protein
MRDMPDLAPNSMIQEARRDVSHMIVRRWRNIAANKMIDRGTIHDPGGAASEDLFPSLMSRPVWTVGSQL